MQLLGFSCSKLHGFCKCVKNINRTAYIKPSKQIVSDLSIIFHWVNTLAASCKKNIKIRMVTMFCSLEGKMRIQANNKEKYMEKAKDKTPIHTMWFLSESVAFYVTSSIWCNAILKWWRKEKKIVSLFWLQI